VTGTVRGDASGEPLAGAVVSLTDLGRATVTDARGWYELRRVPAGVATRFRCRLLAGQQR
jgi:hypothetical protein